MDWSNVLQIGGGAAAGVIASILAALPIFLGLRRAAEEAREQTILFTDKWGEKGLDKELRIDVRRLLISYDAVTERVADILSIFGARRAAARLRDLIDDSRLKL